MTQTKSSSTDSSTSKYSCKATKTKDTKADMQHVDTKGPRLVESRAVIRQNYGTKSMRAKKASRPAGGKVPGPSNRAPNSRSGLRLILGWQVPFREKLASAISLVKNVCLVLHTLRIPSAHLSDVAVDELMPHLPPSPDRKMCRGYAKRVQSQIHIFYQRDIVNASFSPQVKNAHFEHR